ncbi:MAG: hypothetical protein PHE59_04580 [Patescibacteria group bacterium]|nr:hypothetical protein [Patescibacteria group bacterium]MDD5164529.1 hypothetical protein [Patescibacteria group bacterium]MDD5534729.1 hypothetical protein [Patescibacteria group bacterium]
MNVKRKKIPVSRKKKGEIKKIADILAQRRVALLKKAGNKFWKKFDEIHIDLQTPEGQKKLQAEVKKFRKQFRPTADDLGRRLG